MVLLAFAIWMMVLGGIQLNYEVQTTGSLGLGSILFTVLACICWKKGWTAVDIKRAEQERTDEET